MSNDYETEGERVLRRIETERRPLVKTLVLRYSSSSSNSNAVHLKIKKGERERCYAAILIKSAGAGAGLCLSAWIHQRAQFLCSHNFNRHPSNIRDSLIMTAQRE